jgi:hypothetical protein
VIKDKVAVVQFDAMEIINFIYICYGAVWGKHHCLLVELGEFIEDFLGKMSYKTLHV